MDLKKFTPKTVYVTYIAAPADNVWRALTIGEISRHYFFGRRVEIDMRPDGLFQLRKPDDSLDVEGRVVTCVRPRTLAVTWRVMHSEEVRNLPACLVTYQIDDLGPVVRLTMTEAHQTELAEEMLEGGRRGWPVILSNLKTLLETGRPLPEFDFTSGAKQPPETKREATWRIEAD